MHALPGEARAGGWPCLALSLLFVLIALFPLPGSAADVPLQGGWRPVVAGEQAGSVERGDPRLQRFDPARLQAFGTGEAGNWILLWPAQGPWPAPPFVLEARGAGLQTLAFQPPGATVARSARSSRIDPQAWPGHGRLAFAIDASPAPGQALRLHVDARGEPGQVDLVSSSGSRSLDRAASDAVRRWRFAPAMRGGQPVEAAVQVPITFNPK